MRRKNNLYLNDRSTTVDVEPETLLIDRMREDLNLTGTKRGCDNSTAAPATVVVNGKA